MKSILVFLIFVSKLVCHLYFCKSSFNKWYLLKMKPKQGKKKIKEEKGIINKKTT